MYISSLHDGYLYYQAVQSYRRRSFLYDIPGMAVSHRILIKMPMYDTL